MESQERQQWHLLFQVTHGPRFGHKLTVQTKARGREATEPLTLGSWTGIGIPEAMMRTATGLLVAIVEDHLISRYGVQGELPWDWGVEDDPF